MNQAQFHRFINRVGRTLEFAPEVQETKLVSQLRRSLHPGDPASDAQLQFSQEINRLFLFLGEEKTAYLMQICRSLNLELDEKLTKPEADELWLHLIGMYTEWDEEETQF